MARPTYRERAASPQRHYRTAQTRPRRLAPRPLRANPDLPVRSPGEPRTAGTFP